MTVIRKIIQETLNELQKDGVIGVNEYQGEDFDYLEKRIRKNYWDKKELQEELVE